MEPYDNNDELIATLEELRPEPRPEFGAELDARAAAGFPRRSRLGALSPAAALDRLRDLKPRQIMLPAGAMALTAILVATVVVSQDGGETTLNMGGSPPERLTSPAAGGSDQSESVGPMSAKETPEEVDGTVTEGEAVDRVAKGAGDENFDGVGPSVRASNRAIERSAQITLATDSENVGKAASEVFDVVHANRGVVLNSNTRDGAAGAAEAEFELLIPSGKLGDAMAGFSRIGEVRSRHEATTDITAPTVSAGEHLEDAEARIDSLLAQLAAAETEGEQEAVEAELRVERNQAARLRAQLSNLDRRASLSRVYVQIRSGEDSSSPEEGGAWGIGDALDDAGQILAVGAAVALLALAVLGPLALIALLAWLARRTYLRRARQAAL